MFNIGGGEVLVILIVALVFLGPAKLPEIARSLGKATRTIRRVSESFRSELDSAVIESTETQARQRGNELANTAIERLDPEPATHDGENMETEGDTETFPNHNEET